MLIDITMKVYKLHLTVGRENNIIIFKQRLNYFYINLYVLQKHVFLHVKNIFCAIIKKKNVICSNMRMFLRSFLLSKCRGLFGRFFVSLKQRRRVMYR